MDLLRSMAGQGECATSVTRTDAIANALGLDRAGRAGREVVSKRSSHGMTQTQSACDGGGQGKGQCVARRAGRRRAARAIVQVEWAQIGRRWW